MKHVVGHKTIKSRIDVSLDERSFIVCTLYGRVTGALVSDSLERTREMVRRLKLEGRPAYLLVDVTNVTSQDSAARSRAKTIGTLGLDRVAIYNTNLALAMITQYLIRSGGMSAYAQSFRKRRQAIGWLLHGRQPQHRQYLGLRIISGLVVIAMTAAVLVGWAIDNDVLKAVVPGIKPMNPVMAIVLMGYGAALIGITKHSYLSRLQTVFAGSITFAGVLAGMVILIQASAGHSTRLDGVLFHGELGAGIATGFASPRCIVAVLLIGVMFLAILSGQRARWQQYIFHAASLAVSAIALVSIAGYGFGTSDAYGAIYMLPMPLNVAIITILLSTALQTVAIRRPFFERLWNLTTKYIQPIVVAGIVILTTGLAWNQAVINHTRTRDTAIEQELMRNKDDIQDRLSGYIGALRGYRSFFASSDYVAADEFQTFYTSSQLDVNYPGFNAISFARAVPAAQRGAYETEMRRQAATADPSFATYRVYPASPNSTLYPVAFIQPNSATVTRGFDLSSNAARLKTLEEARDTGGIAVTDTIDLNASRGNASLPKRPGFFLTIPLYRTVSGVTTQPQTVAERRTQLYGFVNAVFENSQLFSDVFRGTPANDIKYVLRNARTGEVLYTRPGSNDTGTLPHYTTMQVGGQAWELLLYAPPHFGDSTIGRLMPAMVLAGGSLVTVLATALSVGQVRRKEQALALASAMTEDLNHERDEAVTVRQKDEAILSSIGDAVFAVDTKGTVILFNRTAEDITGQTESYALGRNYKDLFTFRSEKDHRPADGFIKTALSGKQATMTEGTLLERSDGSTIPVADSAAPIVNGKGEVEGVVVVFRDVTREKELERLKNEFVSMASHELRTPMGAIRAFVSMILAGDYGPVNKNLIDPLTDIRSCTLRLVDMVNDLLNVARIEAGRMKFTLSEMPLSEALHGVGDTLGPLAKERGLTLTVAAKKLPPVQADSDKVVQVLTNLVGNALKFTDQGGITIGASESADTVIVTVTDTGAGISEADQLTVFGKFEQVSSVQEGRPAGTGLGLYISREMVRKMGGELWIQQSVLGKGTTFAFMLPCVGTPLAKRVKIDRQRDEKNHPDAV